MILKVTSFLNIFRLFLTFFSASLIFPFNNSKAIYLFLKLSGPTFIKLGQLLATRLDLVGEDIAKRLEVFQDKVPPFSCRKAHNIIKKEFKKSHNELFLEFSSKPVASASIAQVYKCKTIDGELVAVKVLRPNIIKIVNRDILTLKMIAGVISVFSRYYGKKISDILDLLHFCAKHELDLLNEAAAGSALKDNLLDFDGIYVPDIYWNLTTKRVLTMSWVDGIALCDKEAVAKSKIDKVKAAENLVIGYFNQVYRDGFFHADMHPGNLFLMKNSRIAIVDFGIIGMIDKKTRIAIAQILISFLNRDYLKVAKLHLDAGFIPKDTNVSEFALQSRIIGESFVGKSVKDISFADLLAKLLKMTKKYNVTTKPELLLLQKTIMLVEGVGVSLNKELNIWDLSKPWVKDWAKTNVGLDAQIRDCYLEFGEKLMKLPALIENNLEVSKKSDYFLAKIDKMNKAQAGWKFFGLVFFSLWAISTISRFY